MGVKSQRNVENKVQILFTNFQLMRLIIIVNLFYKSILFSHYIQRVQIFFQFLW